MENDLEIISQNEQLLLAYGRFFRNVQGHNNVMVSISGGSDSDIMLDLLLRFAKLYDINVNIFHFVFFDTGIEYEATKRHLVYLEEKYGIKIERVRAIVPVPLGCKKYGQPFLSKYASEMIERLQRHNFDFASNGNKNLNELLNIYPKAKYAVRWWCNDFGEGSSFNISRFSYLKEFMIQNPPNFKISPKCCKGAKKDNAKHYIKGNAIDCNCLGLRKSEGGVRSTAYKTCFTPDKNGITDNYRPIWFFNDKDKEFYVQSFVIKHSDCYEVWGMIRTGCCGCPFGSRFEEELELCLKYEPKLYKACNNIFGDSYAYTRAYRKFKEEMKKKEKLGGQITMFDNCDIKE